MKATVAKPLFILLLLAGLLHGLTGCRSSKPGGTSWLNIAASEPVPLVATPEPTVEPETPAKKKGFWSWLGGGKKTDEADGEAVNGVVPVTPTLIPLEQLPPSQVLTAVSTPPVTSPEPSGVGYRLKIGDPIVLIVQGPANLNERSEQVVDERGEVTVRFLGKVEVVGKTATEVERHIENEYVNVKLIYKEVYVTVHVPNTFYFIGGEVKSPGRYPLVGRMTLGQAVTTAGNFTEWANERKIVLVRNNERFLVDFREIRRYPEQDVDLRAGDEITVPRSIY